MTSFEQDLTDLLDARAERVDVRQDHAVADGPVLLETVGVTSIGERREARDARRGGRNWLLAAAAAVVIVVGVFGLTRSSTSPVTEVAAAGATDEYFSSLFGGDVDFVVWMEPEATQDTTDAVGAFLVASPLIESVPFIDRDQTYAEFEAYWADSPEILLAVEPEELPTSFRVSMIDDLDQNVEAAVIGEVLQLRGVRDVQQAVPFAGDEEALPAELPAEPLFLLPADDASLEGSEGFVSSMEASIGASISPGIAVGRETGTGFDQLMAAVLLDEREYVDSDARVIDGRDVFVARDVDGVVAAELTDEGRWLHYYLNDADTELEALVRATSVVDGQILFQPYEEIIELSRSSNVVPAGQAVMVLPTLEQGTEPTEGIALTTTPTAQDTGLIVLAVSSETVTTVEVRGQVGYRGISPDPSVIADIVTWYEPSGHTVYFALIGPGSALELAESLTVVDEATWRAAIPERELN